MDDKTKKVAIVVGGGLALLGLGYGIYKATKGGGGGGTHTCPTGQHWDGAACVDDSVHTCPTGQHWDGAACVDDSVHTCPTGQHWDGSACVENGAGTIDFTVSNAGLVYTFSPNVSQSGLTAPLVCHWEFGDGHMLTSNANANIKYTYPNADSYDVTLTVTDSLGVSLSVTHTIGGGDDGVGQYYTQYTLPTTTLTDEQATAILTKGLLLNTENAGEPVLVSYIPPHTRSWVEYGTGIVRWNPNGERWYGSVAHPRVDQVGGSLLIISNAVYVGWIQWYIAKYGKDMVILNPFFLDLWLCEGGDPSTYNGGELVDLTVDNPVLDLQKQQTACTASRGHWDYTTMSCKST